WGRRLDELMASIAALVESEVSRFPDNVGHVLGSRSLRSHHSLSARMTYWAWKGRDVVSDGFSFCRNLVGGPERSRAVTGGIMGVRSVKFFIVNRPDSGADY